ncbi:hypothetical protein [Marinomonas sp. UCMA 3892]|uniref:hypothetical protein n=1 Tax=Marinomonas sp. UCMA 3892 TaxID=1972585 RepID=UPI00146D798C|nr:hypothetical protein [Marinomonas sp. UCMA 3892]
MIDQERFAAIATKRFLTMTKEDLEKLDVSQIKEIASKDILADLIQQTSTQEGQQRILD